MRALLALALRASAGRHAEAARSVLLTILLAQLLAAEGAYEARPAGVARPPRRRIPTRTHHAHRSALSGRRPRG